MRRSGRRQTASTASAATTNATYRWTVSVFTSGCFAGRDRSTGRSRACRTSSRSSPPLCKWRTRAASGSVGDAPSGRRRHPSASKPFQTVHDENVVPARPLRRDRSETLLAYAEALGRVAASGGGAQALAAHLAATIDAAVLVEDAQW